MSKRPKIADPTAKDLLVPARATREAVEDFAPMVLYCPQRGQAYTAILTEGTGLVEMLSSLLAEMRAKLGPALWIAVTTDAYVKKVYTEGDVPTGRLETAFKNGDPDVIEQMVVSLKHRYRGVDVAAQAYRYTPADGWEWSEPEDVTEHSSIVINVLEYYM